MKTWRFDAPGQTWVLASDGGIPWTVYWSSALPHGEDLAALAQAGQGDVTGGMLDANPPLSLCPEDTRSFPGQPGLVAYRDDTPIFPKFRETGEALHFRDEALGLSLRFEIATAGDVITAQTVFEAEERLALHWLAAPVLPGPQHATDIIDYAGRWIGEFQRRSTPWRPGIHMREARTGRSGHEHPPFALFPETGATNDTGRVFSMHYGWSGGHRMVAEELPDGRRQIQWGHASGTLQAGTKFRTAPLILAVSDQGFNGTAIAMQRHIRDHVVQWPTPTRPVHYNCWEAVYFDHDLAELTDIAARAAALGAERFVLDDGWFGRRDDDTSSLGDWQVDARKYPNGLKPLIDAVHALGMGFGLWVEPEMVNLNSDLARAHPDWILGPADQIEGRQQRVLDLANPAVADHLFGVLDALLAAHDIDYLKWDHNRVLPIATAAQTDALYRLLGDLRHAHPDVEIESCASGGGRIDAGILAHTHRVWLSDSNDALERTRIQHEAAQFLPAAVTGSHVGPRVCHTSGRTLSMELRAWVAASRHMGFEMDPRELTEDEAQTLKQVTTWWKANRDWMLAGDILRLQSADPSVTAELQRSNNGDQFVVFATKTAAGDQILPRPLRLTGLQRDARYRITLLNRDSAVKLSRGSPALKSGPVEVSGAYLMTHGLTLPWRFPETIWVLQGQRIERET
ncbi:alpha-galactosidase [Actibacterium mucosum KCTC 23349]|uniref:alpha-galactosidase n=1 Tax=Actibacterium mucosum KCTC 23349 TaxID=1454373 RepID=A0A037ZGT5_9RHOB|nr:alpha-galactosidase [Actibacterium mucosum]KAJ55338.1 alpha-galactosidase [Actibacterium mucosum KCTC 23349]